MFDMTGFVGEIEVAGPRVVAFDPVVCDRFLDQVEGVQAGLVELAALLTVTLEQGGGTDLEAGMDHAAVAAARAPAELMLLQEGDRSAPRGQRCRCHHSGVAAAHDYDVDLCWK